MGTKAAVVTGGTGALGRSVVAALLGTGWTVHVPFTSEAPEPAPEGSPGTLRAARADLTDPGAVERFFTGVTASSGGLHLLCNLVGGFASGAAEDTDPSVWERLLAVNATAPFLAIRGAVPLLRAAGGGAVVNVAAAGLSEPRPGMAAYLASKAALASLTRSLAREFAPDAITVNAVAPTIIDTPANRRAMPDADRSTWLGPSEIADVVLFLAGPEGRIVTGNVLELRRG